MPQAILLQDVEKVGQRGTVVDVSKGYLRNYLIPRKLAQPATKSSVAAAERHQKTLDRAAAEATQRAEDNAELLNKTVLTIAHQAGDDGRLFGSVTVAGHRRRDQGGPRPRDRQAQGAPRGADPHGRHPHGHRRGRRRRARQRQDHGGRAVAASRSRAPAAPPSPSPPREGTPAVGRRAERGARHRRRSRSPTACAAARRGDSVVRALRRRRTFDHPLRPHPDRFGAAMVERPALVCTERRLAPLRVLRDARHQALVDRCDRGADPRGTGRRRAAPRLRRATARTGVKDPVIRRRDGGWEAWLCCHPLDEPGREDRMPPRTPPAGTAWTGDGTERCWPEGRAPGTPAARG